MHNCSTLNTTEILCWIVANCNFPRVTFLLLDFWTFYDELLIQMKYLSTIHSTSILFGCFGQFRNVENW